VAVVLRPVRLFWVLETCCCVGGFGFKSLRPGAVRSFRPGLVLCLIEAGVRKQLDKK